MNEVKQTADPDATLIRRFYEEVFNRGNIAFADRVHGPSDRYRFVRRRVVEEWKIFDKLGVHQQLAAIPPAGASSTAT